MFSPTGARTCDFSNASTLNRMHFNLSWAIETYNLFSLWLQIYLRTAFAIMLCNGVCSGCLCELKTRLLLFKPSPWRTKVSSALKNHIFLPQYDLWDIGFGSYSIFFNSKKVGKRITKLIADVHDTAWLPICLKWGMGCSQIGPLGEKIIFPPNHAH